MRHWERTFRFSHSYLACTTSTWLICASLFYPSNDFYLSLTKILTTVEKIQDGIPFLYFLPYIATKFSLGRHKINQISRSRWWSKNSISFCLSLFLWPRTCVEFPLFVYLDETVNEFMSTHFFYTFNAFHCFLQRLIGCLLVCWTMNAY